MTWTNTANNETTYLVYRQDDDEGWTRVYTTKADETTYTDVKPQPLSIGNGDLLHYMVRATNDAGVSDGASAYTQVVGGPDITAHLLAIESHLIALSKKPSQLKKLKAGFYVHTSDQSGNWDIRALKGQTVETAQNSGVLPNGDKTVSVAGTVWLDPAVNYWIYGVWARVIGANYVLAATKVVGHALTRPEPALAKLTWFEAGYNGVFPSAADGGNEDAVAAPAPPQGQDFGLMKWDVGTGVIQGNIIHGAD